MGLDIVTKNISTRVGSYSSVHFLRAEMIIAATKYLKQFDKCEEAKLAKKILENSVNLENSCPVNYSEFDKLKTIDDDELVGLYYWVNHSDCDGFITSTQAKSILITLEKIYEYINVRYFTNETIKLENFYLYDILKDSVDNNESIFFT